MRAIWAVLAIAMVPSAAARAQGPEGFVSCSSETAPYPGKPGVALRNLSGGTEARVVPIIVAYRDYLRADPAIARQIDQTGAYSHVVLAQMSTRCRWYPDQAAVVLQIDEELKKLRKKGYAIITTMWTPPAG